MHAAIFAEIFFSNGVVGWGATLLGEAESACGL
jgi:hypothetical protein